MGGERRGFQQRHAERGDGSNRRCLDRVRPAIRNPDVLLQEPLVVCDGHLYVDHDLHVVRGMRTLIVCLATLFLVPAHAMAQKLELGIALSPAVIPFPSSDPDAVPLVAASPMQLTYRVRGN